MSAPIGKKIKNFRNRANKSQFDIELEIDASPGSLSRIENGSTEPTKETLLKISDALSLNKFERDYLYGSLSEPASEKEIADAIESIREYFSQKGVLAYLIDDRYRIVHASDDFAEFFGYTMDSLKEKLLTHTLFEVMLNPKYNVYDSLKDDLEESLKSNLSKYYFESSFMIGEKPHEEIMSAIKSNSLAFKIWNEVVANPPKNVNTLESRTVKFRFGLANVKMTYSAELLAQNQRYVIVEFTPNNKILKLLQKYI